ncbi:MAG: hypothetical protein K0U33_08675 [Bacteroidetes bacterium]|jgi:hypothetical protein|nr:hypothetical protein [Bacteroidota bacterium]
MNNRLRQLLLFGTLFTFAVQANAQITRTVTNTNDNGAGSLRSTIALH